MKVCLIALGCEKNVVNSEQMLYLLEQAPDMELVADPAEAEVTVVNTCGFIESARAEAVEQILEIAPYSAKILVAGCLAERHKDEILEEMPEVSGLLGVGHFDDVVAAVRDVHEGRKAYYFGRLDEPVSETPRLVTSPPYTAYLKIADGCSNQCSYCVIPRLRGPFRSRPMDAVLAEAEGLVASGVKELILIAQDTTRYGMDLPDGRQRLPELLRALCRLDGLVWLRLLYLYPEQLTDEIIDVVATEPKIVKYLDIPMQHASDKILRAMNRRSTQAQLRALVHALRARIPGVVLRTSLIVGFPGETNDDFAALTDFLQELRLPRVGVFTYSQEEGAPAADYPDQIDEDTKAIRARRVEMIQADIMDAFTDGRIGQTIPVLCEGYDRYAGVYFGRGEADAPEVDGKVFFRSARQHEPGDMVQVLIEESLDGDPMGTACEEDCV